MSPSFKLQCHFILIFLVALRGESRYLEVSDPRTDPSHRPVPECSALEVGKLPGFLPLLGLALPCLLRCYFPCFPPRLAFLPASSSLAPAAEDALV